MKKTIYNIGRSPECDICLYDENNVTSRLHAVLKIGKDGKYYIIDNSSNGTYINGIKMTSGIEVPVSRNDMVSFAGVCELDWSLIPKARNKTYLILIIVAIVIGVIGVIIGGIHVWSLYNKDEINDPIFKSGTVGTTSGGGSSRTPFWSKTPNEDEQNQDVVIESPNKKKKEEAERLKRAEEKRKEEWKMRMIEDIKDSLRQVIDSSKIIVTQDTITSTLVEDEGTVEDNEVFDDAIY